MKYRLFCSFVLFVVAAMLSGCQNPARSSYRTTPEPGIPSPGFTAYDIRMAVREIGQSMKDKWDFMPRKQEKPPIIAFTGIENRTSYRVEVNEIAGWIEDQVLKTGKATFSNAIDVDKRGGQSGEQYSLIDWANESEYVDKRRSPKKGKIQAPDYELFGTVYRHEVSNSSQRQVDYVLEMTLSDIEKGISVWKEMVPIGKNLDR